MEKFVFKDIDFLQTQSPNEIILSIITNKKKYALNSDFLKI
jgi:hypothetical protein